MLEEVNKPGSDIEEYLGEIEKILEEKNGSILEMREAVASFRKNINMEKILNMKVNSLRKKTVRTNYNQGEFRTDFEF